MKALFIERPGKVVVRDLKKPSPKKGEVLVAMHSCGVCGTDLEKARGEALTPPVLGHEVVGEVSELGAEVDGFRVGDRVFTHHHVPCYECELCRRGEYTLCAEFPRHNIIPGGFSEYYIVPAWNVARGAILPLPEAMTYAEGSFIEPIGCCIRGLSRINVENHNSAVIYGAGPVGLTHLMLLQHYGYRRLAIADPSEYRLSFASKLGAPTFDPRDEEGRRSAFEIFGRDPPEIAVLATGSPSAFSDAIRTVSPGGTVLLFGAPPRGSNVSLDLSQYFLKGVTIRPSYSTSENETTLAAKMLESGAISATKLITHRFDLKDAPAAFEIAGEQRCVKAIVNS